jgi:general secretion pathway protein H
LRAWEVRLIFTRLIPGNIHLHRMASPPLCNGLQARQAGAGHILKAIQSQMTHGEGLTYTACRDSTVHMTSYHLDQMAKKEAVVLQPTLPTGINSSCDQQDGFTLLEVVCVVAIMALLAAVTLPGIPRGTSRSRLESYAIAAAALLKADHTAAVREKTQIATQVNVAGKVIRSGATGRAVQIPADVTVDALLSARCGGSASSAAILFFSSGMSCGGYVTLSSLGVRYEIRVNWLTGGVEVAQAKPA